MTRRSATASVEVDADPLTAFTVFTDEIDLWWVRGPINFFDSARLVAMRVEPGVGGRILEVYDDEAHDVLEIARITDWEPGARLVYRSAVDDTETDIRFEPTGTGTKVTVEQYLLPDGERAFLYWPKVLRWLPPWLERRESAPRRPREAGRLAIVLKYENPVPAARWLREVFQLGSWDVDDEPVDDATWIDLHVGDAPVVILPLDGSRPSQPPVTHVPWVFVDDLDQHLAHAEANGATIVAGIRQHGYRAYDAEDLEGYRWTFAQARPAQVSQSPSGPIAK